jgi:hypothetical protein
MPRSRRWTRLAFFLWCVVDLPAAGLWMLSFVWGIPLGLAVVAAFFLMPGVVLVVKVQEMFWPGCYPAWSYRYAQPALGCLVNLLLFAAAGALLDWLAFSAQQAAATVGPSNPDRHEIKRSLGLRDPGDIPPAQGSISSDS